MRRALRILLWRDVVGRTRSMGRRLRSGRGIAGALGILLFLAAIGSARILQWADPEAGPPPLVAAAGVRELGPLLLLALVALNTLSGRGLYFRPAEIGVLFVQPRSRAASSSSSTCSPVRASRPCPSKRTIRAPGRSRRTSVA